MDREGSPFSAQDISQEELEVFLQEADEQLQLLDEDFIALEKEGSNGEILQEIFRAAHTIKGSSAMLGYQRMSSVSHAMETLLDKLRNGSLSATVGVINVLLCGLDALKSLKRELVSGESCTIDLDSVVAELKKTAAGESIVAQVAGAGRRGHVAEGLGVGGPGVVSRYLELLDGHGVLGVPATGGQPE